MIDRQEYPIAIEPEGVGNHPALAKSGGATWL